MPQLSGRYYVFVAYATLIMPKEQIQIEQSLIFLTNRVGRLLANEIRLHSGVEEHGLLPHHMGILSDLWKEDGVRQQDLVVSIIKDKATVARALSFLEKLNILVRVTDSSDKRNKRIYLTHKGKALKDKISPKARELESKIAQQLDPDEYATCMNVLKNIYRILTKSK